MIVMMMKREKEKKTMKQNFIYIYEENGFKQGIFLSLFVIN